MQNNNTIRGQVTAAFNKQFSWKFLRSVVSLREVFLPITIQKLIVWSIYFTILGGLITAEVLGNLVKYLSIAAHANIIALSIFLWAVEPVYFFFMMLFSRYPKIEANPERVVDTLDALEACVAPTIDTEAPRITREKAARDTSIIIACHKSQDLLKKTLEHWLKIVPARNIYVVDNGDAPYPLNKEGVQIDDSKRIVNEVNAEINYVFSERGNKTYALYRGALEATTSKVIICDDDIIPHPDMLKAYDLISEEYKAVVYPIKAIAKETSSQQDTSSAPDILTAWQNLEYCLADHAKNYEDRSCGPTRPHGACSMWDREFMLKMLLKKHDTRFMGEDLKMGLRATYEKQRMRYAHGIYVKTYVPESFIGPMPNYYTQRVRVWEMGRHIYTFMVLRYLITTWQTSHGVLRTIRDNAALKMEQLYYLYQNVADWLRLPVLLLCAKDWEYWVISVACYGLLIVVTLIWNYVKLRHHPEEQHKLVTILTYPIYKIIYKVFSILAVFRALFIFIPNYSSLIRIDQLEKFRADILARRTALGHIESSSDLPQSDNANNSASATSNNETENRWAPYVLQLLMAAANHYRLRSNDQSSLMNTSGNVSDAVPAVINLSPRMQATELLPAITSPLQPASGLNPVSYLSPPIFQPIIPFSSINTVPLILEPPPSFSSTMRRIIARVVARIRPLRIRSVVDLGPLVEYPGVIIEHSPLPHVVGCPGVIIQHAPPSHVLVPLENADTLTGGSPYAHPSPRSVYMQP